MKKVQKTPFEHLRTWVEIDTGAITHNYRVFRKMIGKRVKLAAVVKSNAYGHNIVEFSRTLESLGVDRLGVDSLVEGLSVREAGVKTPILVLGHTLSSMFETARKSNIGITISSMGQLKEALKLSKNKKPLAVHIKVDTGMHRQGFQLHEEKKLLELLHRSSSQFVIEGLYTHFAEAKDPRRSDGTRRQIAEFHKWIDAFHEAGFKPLVHASATAGTLLYQNAHFDMVRVGIGMYGLWPSGEAEHALSHKITLKPALAWKAVVSEVKEVKKGERVGYDFTELLMRNSRIAIVPIGYWHGMPRLASSRARVLIHGKSARIIGRVSMDMIVVDVTDIPKAKAGDIATLIGRDSKEEIKAGELAMYAGTTHYEIITRLNPLMMKVYR